MKELVSYFDILKVLGHGGFSAVFKARRKTDGAIVALKQLDLTIENEQQKEYRDFKEEVDILKKLNHPNIVKIYDEYVLDHKPALEMEFIDGETLETILKREKFFSIEDTLDLIGQISGALSYCHHYAVSGEHSESSIPGLAKRGTVVHNDINPKNILRTQNADGTNRYVVIDFGLSFTDPDAVRHSKKEEGMAEYKAPEKWKGTMVEASSDIYSLGIVIYELLTGTVPFPVKDYKTTGEMIQLEEKHKKATIPDICEKRLAAIINKEQMALADCDIPEWLAILVAKCLEKEPQNRFQSGEELNRFFKDGIEGRVDIAAFREDEVIQLDPENPEAKSVVGAYLEVVPNFLTPTQQYAIIWDTTVLGRWSDLLETSLADFAIKTADRFISKKHCQIIRKPRPEGGFVYQLVDPFPSKNGTYFNTMQKTQRLEPHIRINLTDGDYFVLGNTKIVFHEN